MSKSKEEEPSIAKDAVLCESEQLPKDTPIIKGFEWNNGINHEELLNSYLHSGFQATNFGKAVQELNKMVYKNALLNNQLIL